MLCTAAESIVIACMRSAHCCQHGTVMAMDPLTSAPRTCFVRSTCLHIAQCAALCRQLLCAMPCCSCAVRLCGSTLVLLAQFVHAHAHASAHALRRACVCTCKCACAYAEARMLGSAASCQSPCAGVRSCALLCCAAPCGVLCCRALSRPCYALCCTLCRAVMLFYAVRCILHCAVRCTARCAALYTAHYAGCCVALRTALCTVLGAVLGLRYACAGAALCLCCSAMFWLGCSLRPLCPACLCSVLHMQMYFKPCPDICSYAAALSCTCVLCAVPTDVLQEVGGLTQLKAVFPKVFNKRIPWNDGERLQDVDLLVYEFRRIKGALRVPGTIQQLYRDKVSFPLTLKLSSWLLLDDTAALRKCLEQCTCHQMPRHTQRCTTCVEASCAGS